MPYNKGDFTQQGVAGYVNGGLLLNNKRDVTTRISTDEETAGIDSVDIKIKDRLNDIEYHITGENLSEGENVIGGGGEIEIENPTLIINYHQQLDAQGDLSTHMFLGTFEAPSQTVPACVVTIYNNKIGFDCPMPNESGTVKLYMLPTTTTAILFNDTITDITSDNANNCQLVSQQGMTILMVLNNGENASIDLSYTIGGGV